jgi:very-short-patch-repair endonuclease
VLSNGHVVILEIDGGFHMEVEHWEDDLVRQRRISGPGRTVVRCTSREVRDDHEQLGRDLLALGVPRRAPKRAV